MELISGRSLAHDQAGGQSRAGDVMLPGVMMVHITLLHLKSDHISISNNNCIVKETAAGQLFGSKGKSGECKALLGNEDTGFCIDVCMSPNSFVGSRPHGGGNTNKIFELRNTKSNWELYGEKRTC